MSRVVSRWFITEAPIAVWRRNGFTWAIGAKAPRLLLVTGFPLQFFCEHGQGFIRIAARAASGIKRERSRSSQSSMASWACVNHYQVKHRLLL